VSHVSKEAREPARRRPLRRLRALALNARRRLDAHAVICGRCSRAANGSGEACKHGRDLERDARQAQRRAS
jgi:hypothetical protein